MTTAGRPPAVDVRNLSVAFAGGRRTGRRRPVALTLDGVTLSVRSGERVGLIGPSGAGKSTLLGVLSGAVTPARLDGEVRVLGTDVLRARGRELRALRADIGTVHQHLNLVGALRVVHNVNAGRLARWSLARSLWSFVHPQGVELARGALADVGLADRIFDRTDTLSGGQQQRVALARVVVQRPSLVLADEPVSSLDPALAVDVLHLLTDIVRSQGAALVVSLHDFALARRFCDRLVGLRDGRVLFDRPSARVREADAAELYGTAAFGFSP